jgi:hypothetical protein
MVNWKSVRKVFVLFPSTYLEEYRGQLFSGSRFDDFGIRRSGNHEAATAGPTVVGLIADEVDS